MKRNYNNAIVWIQDKAIDEARKRFNDSLGGCTALAAIFFMGKLFIANAGDCRFLPLISCYCYSFLLVLFTVFYGYYCTTLQLFPMYQDYPFTSVTYLSILHLYICYLFTAVSMLHCLACCIVQEILLPAALKIDKSELICEMFQSRHLSRWKGRAGIVRLHSRNGTKTTSYAGWPSS